MLRCNWFDFPLLLVVHGSRFLSDSPRYGFGTSQLFVLLLLSLQNGFENLFDVTIVHRATMTCKRKMFEMFCYLGRSIDLETGADKPS